MLTTFTFKSSVARFWLLGLLALIPALPARALEYNLTLEIQDKPYFLFDDAQDGDNQNLTGGYWYVYDDSGSGGDSLVLPKPFTMTVTDQAGPLNADYFAQITGQVTTTFAYGFLGLGTSLKDGGVVLDLTPYKGLRFFAKGDGKSYRVKIRSNNFQGADVPDYYGYQFQTTAAWQEYSLPFSQFTQEGWGTSKTLNECLLTALDIQWQTVGQPHAAIDFQVVNKAFLTLDHCEDGDAVNRLGGSWYSFARGSASVNPSPFSMTYAAGNGAFASDYFARITGTIGNAGSSVGLGTTLTADGGVMDLSVYSGIRFSAKGDGQTYRINMISSNISDADYFGYDFQATAQWRDFIVPFTDFYQKGSGVPQLRSESLRNVTRVEWRTTGQSDADLQIDGLAPASLSKLFLRAVGQDIRDGNNANISLTGLCAANGVYSAKFYPGETYQLTAGDYAAMKSRGVKVVRFYLQYYWLNDPNGFFGFMDEQIRRAAAENIYLVLNLHYFGTSDEAVAGTEDGFYAGDKYGRGYDLERFWRLISQRYKNEPWIAGYDLINEPRTGLLTADQIHAKYDSLIQTIRANSDRHLILVETPWGTGDIRKHSDTNLAYSFHYYEPYEFTHQTFYTDEWYELGIGFPFTAQWGSWAGGFWAVDYRTGTSNWEYYESNAGGAWADLSAAAGNPTASFSIFLNVSGSNGQVWFDDIVLKRRHKVTLAEETLPLANADFSQPKTYVTNPQNQAVEPSYLPAGWYMSVSWTPGGLDYDTNRQAYYRLDFSQDHTGVPGSGSMFVDGSKIYWYNYASCGQSAGIKPSFFPIDSNYEYQISGYIKSANNTTYTMSMGFEFSNVTQLVKDADFVKYGLAYYEDWSHNNLVPVLCTEWGTTNPSNRGAYAGIPANSPADQTAWVGAMRNFLNNGIGANKPITHWMYHVYKSYFPNRGDIFGLFDTGLSYGPDTTLLDVLFP